MGQNVAYGVCRAFELGGDRADFDPDSGLHVIVARGRDDRCARQARGYVTQACEECPDFVAGMIDGKGLVEGRLGLSGYRST